MNVTKLAFLLCCVFFSFAKKEKNVLFDDLIDPLTSTLNIIFPDPDNKIFKVIVCSYNNASSYIDGELVCEKNIRSIFAQTYEHFKVIFIDDFSTDGTFEAVQAIVDELGEQDRFTLIKNPERMGHLHNQNSAIWTCLPTDVVLIIDGDDWLLDNNAFTLINEIYKDPDVWLTYGNYQRIPFADWAPICEVFPDKVVQNSSYRNYKWVSSHLRTFYAGLYQLIIFADLLNEGNFWSAAADLAIMFPMLEMANGKYHFVQNVIYGYNRLNPLNICSGPRLAMQNECARLIRLKQRYSSVTAEDVFMVKKAQG
jgi:glycosyltransferase involved in cell wall biosynthesis